MKKFLKLILLIFFSFTLIWGGGLIWFKSRIPQSQEADQKNADAIIVLTGGSERLAEGVSLLQKEKAQKIFVSGVGEGVNVTGLLRGNYLPQSLEASLGDKIELGYKAGDTKGNAEEAAEWVSANNYKTIFLVTSNYHMPRSLLEFKLSMPEVEIIPHPVFPAHVKLERWWKFPGTRELIILEYNKYIATAIKLEFQRRQK